MLSLSVCHGSSCAAAASCLCGFACNLQPGQTYERLEGKVLICLKLSSAQGIFQSRFSVGFSSEIWIIHKLLVLTETLQKIMFFKNPQNMNFSSWVKHANKIFGWSSPIPKLKNDNFCKLLNHDIVNKHVGRSLTQVSK